MHPELKVIAVEDEPLARAGLVSFIHEVKFLKLLRECENALEANLALSDTAPDLMFLDIQMPKITGIDFLKSLQKPPLVIFTTAYPNYALQGFDLDVVDYLVKPYPFDRFLKAANKARALHQLKNGNLTPIRAKDHFFAKADNKMERINFQDIFYVEAMENYVAIFSQKGRTITLMTMKTMEDILPARYFLRIHKTYLISIDKIQSIEGNEVRVNGKLLPISRQRRKEILDRLIGFQ